MSIRNRQEKISKKLSGRIPATHAYSSIPAIISINASVAAESGACAGTWPANEREVPFLQLLPPSPFHQTVLYSALASPSKKTSPDGETMPVFKETMPVRVKSGHFTGVSGIAPGRKPVFRILWDQGLEQHGTLISFSDGKNKVRTRLPCRFLPEPCRIRLPEEGSGHFTGPDYRIPQTPVMRGEVRKGLTPPSGGSAGLPGSPAILRNFTVSPEHLRDYRPDSFAAVPSRQHRSP
jgi:hypothetical protein